MSLGSKNRKNHSQMPEVNLVPMMDVILTILTFFIILSMSLSGESSSVDLTLPSTKTGVSQSAQKSPDPLIVNVDSKSVIYVGTKQLDNNQLAQKIKVYLSQHPSNGAVVLKADNKLPYSRIIEVLGQMRAVGGEKVSLAVNKG